MLEYRAMVKLLYPELSYKILGALFTVHNRLGKGYQEKYYQRAVAMELRKRDIPFTQEYVIPLQYEGTSIGRYFVDFLIDGSIIVEVKVVDRWKPIYFKQVLGYLQQTNKPLALLANFGGDRLRYRRIVNFAAVTNQHE